MADAVPPVSTTAYFDASGKNKRSTAYNQLLHALNLSTASDLRDALGDMYSKWIDYRNDASNWKPDTTQRQLFNQFANRYLDPVVKNAGDQVFALAESEPLTIALNNFVNTSFYQEFKDSAGDPVSLPKYSGTVDAAKAAINGGGGPVTIDYNSATADTSSNGTTVHGSASGFYSIFSGGASVDFQSLNELATSSNFSIKGTIGKYGTMTTQAAQWYDGSQVSRSYNAKNDYDVWDKNSNQGDWDSFFSENGSLARRVSQLLLVSDYDLTVTSSASYSKSDYQKISTEARFGVWPFFSGTAKATHEQKFTHNEDGSFSVRYKLDKGKTQIWGATIQSAPN
ncbi:hypothetical protein [Candidatus Rhodobacter oscarellae]|nr:hypothetical protein [Candidatus Rhodobacter lobularis]